MSRSKMLTKDCPSCDKMNIGDDYTFLCNWGKGKKAKVLKENKHIKNCNLVNKKG